FNITQKYQREYEKAVAGELLTQQLFAQKEYEKTAQSIYEREIKPKLEQKYQALWQSGKYTEKELQEAYRKEVIEQLSQRPELKEIEQTFKNKAESISAGYASKYQTLATTVIEKEVGNIVKEFQTEMKKEMIKGKLLDIPWQVGLSVGIGAVAGAGATALSKVVPEGIIRTAGGTALLTKSELATVGGLALGTGLVASSVRDITKEFKETAKLDKSLAYKELGVNIAGLVGTGVGFGIGYSAGAREMSRRIAMTEVTKEFGINIGQEVGKGGIIGRGFTIQKVSYEVPLLFTKKPMQELRVFEYPFAGAVSSEGTGRQALAFFKKSGIGVAREIGGIETKGYFVFGEATLRQYEPFKGGWALAKESLVKPSELFGKVVAVEKGKQAFFTEVGGERKILKFGRGDIYFTTSEALKGVGIRGGGISRELKRLELGFKTSEFSIKMKTPVRVFAQTEIREKTLSKKLSFLIPKLKPAEESFIPFISKSKPFTFKPLSPSTSTISITKQLQKIIPTPKFETPIGKTRTTLVPPRLLPSIKSPTIAVNREIARMRQVSLPKLSREMRLQIPSFSFAPKQAERYGLAISQRQLRKGALAFRTSFKTLGKQLERETSIFKFNFKQTMQPLFRPSLSFSTKIPSLTPFPPPIIPFPPLPKIGFEFKRGWQDFFAKGRGYKYQPSLSAIALGIKAPSIPKTASLGFTIRPIITKSRRKR
ncbi:MAG: hypothetical protein QW279_13955, partial [Candidatus Jordarchaeaceae archaeon]